MVMKPAEMVLEKNMEEITASKKSYKLNLTSLRRLVKILKILFSSHTSMLFVLLLILCIGQQFIIYNVGLLPSRFFTVLGEKDKTEFKPLIVRSFCLILLISLCNSAVNLTSGQMYVVCREILTNHLHRKYFASSVILYHVNVLQQDVDNIDQRITQDVERLCSQLRELASKLVIAPLTIIYYSIQCFRATGYIGPILIYVYFLLATIVNKLIMSLIVNLVFKQEKCEGDFRYWHTVVRSYAESITFLKGEKKECNNVAQYFFKLLFVQRKIIIKEMFLNFSTNFFDYIGSILSYIVISVPIFAGKYDNLSPVSLTSLISKNAFVSMYLISCFSTLIDMSSKLTDVFAYAHRIGELIECLNTVFMKLETAPDDEKLSVNTVDSHRECNNILTLTEVTYSAPRSVKNMIRDLNVRVQRNKNVLITGKAGSGKTSLLRVIFGIWKPHNGHVLFNVPQNSLLFLPQKTFLTMGSLIDQVIYPLCKKHIIDIKVINTILEEVGLSSVISRAGGLDAVPCWNWLNILSPGEIQRLSFGRILYHQPLLAIMDEPTSALGEDEEKQLYAACKLRGITVITIGHRESLKNYHDMCLNFKGNGEWTFYAL